MEDNLERKVKGIWIPIDIWEDKDLTWNEKILFLEIDSFTSNSRDCFISNEYISKLLNVTQTTANKILSSLIKKGYIIKTLFDGRRRFVKSALHLTTRQGCTLEQGRVALNDNILNKDILNTITNTITTIDPLSSDNGKAKKNIPLWKTDSDVYKQLVEDARIKLKADTEFQSKQERYFANINYELSIDKGCDYWLSDEGYKKAKSSKGEINMLSRLKNNFDKNKVYNPFRKTAYDRDSFVQNKVNELQKEIDKVVINGQTYK